MGKETYKNVRKNRFTQVSNDMAWDKDLTLQAKGLLLIFLSNSDDWDLHMKEIIKRSKNGRDAHYKIVDELIEKGYFARIEIHNEKNQFEEMIYVFSDNKEDVLEFSAKYKDNPKAVINPDKKRKVKTSTKKPVTENQETGNQDSGNQFPENQDNNNNNQKDTNPNNTNLNNTNLSINKEEIQNSGLSSYLQEMLIAKIDRLIDHNISFSTILTTYEIHKENVNDAQFISALNFAVNQEQIANFENLMASLIQKQLNFNANNQIVKSSAPQSAKKEMVPDWLSQEPELIDSTTDSTRLEFLKQIADFYKEGMTNVNEKDLQEAIMLGLLSKDDIAANQSGLEV